MAIIESERGGLLAGLPVAGGKINRLGSNAGRGGGGKNEPS